MKKALFTIILLSLFGFTVEAVAEDKWDIIINQDAQGKIIVSFMGDNCQIVVSRDKHTIDYTAWDYRRGYKITETGRIENGERISKDIFAIGLASAIGAGAGGNYISARASSDEEIFWQKCSAKAESLPEDVKRMFNGVFSLK
jgi:hypothetical protein